MASRNSAQDLGEPAQGPIGGLNQSVVGADQDRSDAAEFEDIDRCKPKAATRPPQPQHRSAGGALVQLDRQRPIHGQRLVEFAVEPLLAQRRVFEDILRVEDPVRCLGVRSGHLLPDRITQQSIVALVTRLGLRANAAKDHPVGHVAERGAPVA